jgi:hypothetical protein
MFGGHFYHGTIRKIVSVFGTLFNNINVVRKDGSGNVVSITRVPLAYGPRQKFLARIDEQPNLDADKVAIKLPRMSFEISGLIYDTSIKTNRTYTIPLDQSTNNNTSVKDVVRNYAPYRLSFQLSIMAKNQDDALQCLEQILPHFQPEYTVTIKDLDTYTNTADLPFVLTGVTLSDEYDGDFMQRRAIIYTLDFETKLRFYGPVSKKAVIKSSDIDFTPIGESPTNKVDSGKDKLEVSVVPSTAGPNSQYTVHVAFNFIDSAESYRLAMAAGNSVYTVGELVTDTTTATTARVKSFNNGILTIDDANGIFRIGNTIVGATSGCSRTISGIEAIVYPIEF